MYKVASSHLLYLTIVWYIPPYPPTYPSFPHLSFPVPLPFIFCISFLFVEFILIYLLNFPYILYVCVYIHTHCQKWFIRKTIVFFKKIYIYIHRRKFGIYDIRKELNKISVTPLPKIIVFMVLLYIFSVYRCIYNIYKINHCTFYHCRYDIISVVIKYFVCQRLGIPKQPIYGSTQAILEFLVWRHLMSGL